MIYLLESSDGKGAIEIAPSQLGVTVSIRTKFYSMNTDSTSIEAKCDFPIAHKDFLKNFMDVLFAIHEHITKNKSSSFKLPLFEDIFFIEIITDSSLIHALDKRWCAFTLCAPPRTKTTIIIKLDVTVIDRFLENNCLI